MRSVTFWDHDRLQERRQCVQIVKYAIGTCKCQAVCSCKQNPSTTISCQCRRVVFRWKLGWQLKVKLTNQTSYNMCDPLPSVTKLLWTGRSSSSEPFEAPLLSPKCISFAVPVFSFHLFLFGKSLVMTVSLLIIVDTCSPPGPLQSTKMVWFLLPP